MTTWEVIARDYQRRWAVPNCLGTVIAKRIPVEAVPEHRWMYQNCRHPSLDPYFLFILYFTANHRITCGSIGFPGLHDDPDNITNIFEMRQSGFPSSRTPPGSTVRLPYTFLGGDTLPAHSRLRVPLRAKEDHEKRAIERGLRPAERAFHTLLARFGCLRGTVPIPSFGFAIYLNRAIGSLHNYLMAKSPEYAHALDQVMTDEDLSLPQLPITASIPRYAIDVDKEWKELLHMDEDTFQSLLKVTLPSLLEFPHMHTRPEVRLREGLRYLATAKGYDGLIETILQATFLAIALSLEEYAPLQVPIPEQHWLRIAADFEQQMQLPHCVGVIYPHVLLMPDPKTKLALACEVLVLDAFGRVSYCGPMKDLGAKAFKALPIDQVVEEFLDTVEFGLPEVDEEEEQELMFIGSEVMGTHSLLATTVRAGHFSQGQLKRAKHLHEAMDAVLDGRWAVMGNRTGKPMARGVQLSVQIVDEKTGGLSAARTAALSFAWPRLHNFLVDKSPTYGDAFKGVDN